MSKDINIKNKKAKYEYEFTRKFVAGIMLVGTEIKSIRNNQVNISDAYCIVDEKEIWIKNLHISEYQYGSHNNHNPTRERKLLLNKEEISKIESKVKSKGTTIIPLRLFVNNKGRAKIEIAIAKGKKIFDKRHDLKEKDTKRDLDRIKKTFKS